MSNPSEGPNYSVGYDSPGEQYEPQWVCSRCENYVLYGGQVMGPNHLSSCPYWSKDQGTPIDAAEQEAASLNVLAGRIDVCMQTISDLRCKDDVIEQQLSDILSRLDGPQDDETAADMKVAAGFERGAATAAKNADDEALARWATPIAIELHRDAHSGKYGPYGPEDVTFDDAVGAVLGYLDAAREAIKGRRENEQ